MDEIENIKKRLSALEQSSNKPEEKCEMLRKKKRRMIINYI